MFYQRHVLTAALTLTLASPVVAQQAGLSPQLARQQQVLASLTNPDMQSELGLTTQQVQQLGTIMQQAQGQLGALESLAETNRLEAVHRYRALHNYTLQEAIRVLNPTQRRLFRQMAGVGPMFNPSIGSPTR